MSKIKVDSISNKTDDGAPELTYGAIIPSGQQFTVNGNVNVSGIITASSFSGNGSGLTGLRIATPSKAIAYQYIIGDNPPLRS